MNNLTPEDIKNITKTLKRNGWWNKLLDKNDTSVSSSSFYLVSVTIVGLLLLLVPMIVLCIEVYFNHTVQTDLHGMAAYIGAVAGLFASGGIVKGWISYNDSKTNVEKYRQEKYNNCDDSSVNSEGD